MSKSKLIQVRVELPKLEQFKAAAAADGLSLSAWVTMVCCRAARETGVRVGVEATGTPPGALEGGITGVPGTLGTEAAVTVPGGAKVRGEVPRGLKDTSPFPRDPVEEPAPAPTPVTEPHAVISKAEAKQRLKEIKGRRDTTKDAWGDDFAKLGRDLDDALDDDDL